MATMLTPKRFIVLGDAGAGKSSFINFLYNWCYGTREDDEIFCDHPKVKLAIPCANWLDCLDQQFKHNNSERDIHDQTQSQTQACATYKFQTANIYLQIIDTPGFNDTNGTDVDEKNLASIEQVLKEAPFLSGIMIVVNGAIPRLGVSFKNFLHLLHQVWPNDLLNNCVAILTNCDELSVNLDPSVLREDLNVNESKTFHFQNSLFRWDRKNQSSKTIRRFRQDFQENIEKIDKLLHTLLQFGDVSTKSFEIGSIKISLIERCIFRSVQSMISLLKAYKEQQVAQSGIDGARSTMESNKRWEKHHEINAIRWVEAPQYQSLSPPLAQPKFTRQSSISVVPTTSSQMTSSSSNQSILHESKSFVNGQQRSHSHSKSYNTPSSIADLTHREDEKCYKQSDQIDSHYENEKRSPSKSAMSQSSVNYSSAYDSTSLRTQTPSNSYTSGTAVSNFKPAIGENNVSIMLPTSFCENSQHPDEYSTKPSSSYSSHNINYPLSSGSSSYRPLYQQQQTKIQVTIPDNEARSHHDYAQQQEHKLQQKTQWLKDEQQELSIKIKSLLKTLKQQVAELNSINKNYNIIERNRDLLVAFKELIKYMGDSSEMERYYEETVNILSKK